jgi:hypothetical protein
LVSCYGNTPSTLRSAGESDTFTLVGDCYIHDFMHREMLEDFLGSAKANRAYSDCLRVTAELENDMREC